MADQDVEPEDGESPEPPRPKKKKRRHSFVEESPRESYSYDRGRTWTSTQLMAFVLVALVVGGFGGYTARGGGKGGVTAASDAAPVETVAGPRVDPSAAAPAAAPAAGADKFGRPPGDEHFGHDHPPAQQGAAPAAPAPAPGPDGKDSFGRAPGSEHFGHNHP